jgi:tetratricopeptide (TPR) repeat protein
LAGRVQEPPSGARVPRWLRQVLLRGLAIDPAARHTSMAAVLAALRADPKIARRRWLRAAAAVGLVGAATVGWSLAHRREVRACSGAEQKLLGVWDAPKRAAIAAAFRASGKPFAEAALHAVERVFEGYARDWAAMHVDACEATRLRGEQSQEMLDLRMTCLADRLTQLKTLSDLYATADGSVVERAAQSAQSLPGLALCADTAALRAPIPPPRDPQTRQRVEEVRQRLARASALGLASRYGLGLELTRPALHDAEALSYPPVEAEAQLRLGELLLEHGEHDEAARALHRAYVAALEGRHDDAAARASIDLIAVHQSHHDEAQSWVDVAQALVARLQRKDDLLSLLYTRRSLLRSREAKYDEALRDGLRALELDRRTFGPEHYRLAATYHQLGIIHDAQGEYAQALESYERGYAIEQKTLGPDHPLLAKTLIGMAVVHDERGEHERSVATLQQAEAILRRVQADHPSLAFVYTNLGSALQALGRPREAFEQQERAYEAFQKRLGTAYETAAALQGMGMAKLDLDEPAQALRYSEQAEAMCERALGASHPICGQILAAVGEAQRRLGKLDEAMAQFRRSVSIGEKLGSTHPQLVPSLLGIARIELARHAAASATATLERARTISAAQPGDGGDLADINFALAQSLWMSGDRREARNLATQAQAGYAKVGPRARKSLEEVGVWLESHH